MQLHMRNHCGGLLWLGLIVCLSVGCGGRDKGGTAPAAQTPATSPAAVPVASPVPSAGLPAWTPEAALVEQLGPYEDLQGQQSVYQIRVPRDFVALQRTAPPTMGMKVYAWGPAQATPVQESPGLVVTFMTPPPNALAEIRRTSLNDMMQQFLGTNLAQSRHTILSGTTVGRIGEWEFAKTNWSGTLETPTQWSGIAFVGKDDPCVLIMLIRDYPNHDDKMIRLATASALTLRKKDVASSPAAPVEPEKLTKWESSRFYTSDLGDYQTCGAFELRLPWDYEALPMPPEAKAAPNMSFYVFAGSIRPDGTRPMLMIECSQQLPSMSAPPAERMLQDFFTGVRTVGKIDLKQQGAVDKGLIDKWVFSRTRCEGRHPETQQALHGFVYCGVCLGRWVAVLAVDVEPHNVYSMKVANAAILTLRPKTQPTNAAP